MQLSEEEIIQGIKDKLFDSTGKRTTDIDEALIEKGILSSITIAELAIALEKHFKISVSFMHVTKENFQSVHSMKKLIQKLTQAV